MMVNLMRTNQRWLMIVIIFLVSVSLIVFYSNRTEPGRLATDRVGSLYGQSVSGDDFSRIQRRLAVASSLGTYDLLRAAAEDRYDGQGSPISAINYLVLEHEAAKFGIQPTEEEVRAAGERLIAFQGPNGGYDPQRYAQFVESELNYRGLGPNQVDELVRMNLSVERLRAIITATVVVSPQEVRTNYEEAYGKTEASVLRLKSTDYAAVPEPGEDEIKKYFNDQKDQFKQPERRKVQYVKFTLSDTERKLPRAERMAALKPLADQAAGFLEHLLDQKDKSDFAAVAAADKLPVQETPDFEEEQRSGYPEAAIPGFAQAAFALSTANPDSDAPLGTPSESPDTYYDLHLSGVTPERPLTLEEARPKIVAAIKAERAGAALTAKAEEIRAKIADAMKAGHPFADAAKEAGQVAQDVPPFALAELRGASPDTEAVAEVAVGLATGELSKFTPDKDGGFFVYVRGRTPADEAKFQEAKNGFTMQIQQRKSEMYFLEWLRASRDSAKPQFNLRSQS